MASFTIASPKDNVAAAACDLEAGTVIFFKRDGEELVIPINTDLRPGNKIALSSIKKGEQVIFQSLSIGAASCDIEKGDHVDDHKIELSSGQD